MQRSAEIRTFREGLGLAVKPGLVAHRSTGAELDYFGYVPRNATPKSPLLVTVHGLERLALQHAVRFSRLAEQHGFVVLAPLFSRSRTPHYQRLVAGPTGEQPSAAFAATVELFLRNTGLNAEPLRLFGYSGGAQFAMRYALLGDLPVARLALAAPGWFTMPDAELPYPYGLGASEMSNGKALDVDRLLSIPVLLAVGARDMRRDRSLNREQIIDKTQGRTRFERSVRWSAAMQAAAAVRNLPLKTDLRILPGAGHDFSDNMESHALGGIVVNWLINGAE